MEEEEEIHQLLPSMVTQSSTEYIDDNSLTIRTFETLFDNHEEFKTINEISKMNNIENLYNNDMVSSIGSNQSYSINYQDQSNNKHNDILLKRQKKLRGRPHFSISKRSRFPQWLLYHSYYARDFPMRPLGFSIYPIEGFKRHLYEYDDFGRQGLVYDPRFIIGQSVRSLDLRYWVDLKAVVEYIEEQNITTIEELLLNNHPEATSVFLEQLSKSPLLSKSLIALNLASCHTIDSLALDILGNLKTIKMLVISDVHSVTEKTISSLCNSLENMTALDISGCKSVTDETLKELAQSMRFRLISLATARNNSITHIGINELVLLCENMKHLDLSDCPRVAFMGVVVRHISGEIQHASRSLRRICIDNNKEMNVHALDWICAANFDLEVVSLMNIQSVTSGIVLGLAMGCKRLNTLNISRCSQVGPSALMSMESCGKSLTDLNISHIGSITSEALSSLLVNCPSLAILDCSGNKGIQDASFADIQIIDDFDDGISEASSKRSKYSARSINLRRLSIAKTSMTSFGVACMAERCKQLRFLNISYLRHVTDAAVSVIAGCCSHLREFYADDCVGLSEKSIIEIIYECHKLECIKLSTSMTLLDAWGTRFVQYTDEVLISALDGAPALIEIGLRNQFGITFKDSWFSDKFPYKGHRSLRKIDLRGVDNIYLPNAAKVFRSCYDLNEVFLSDEDSLPGVRSTKFRLDAFECAPYAKVFPEDFDDNVSITSSIESPNNSPEKSVSQSLTSSQIQLPSKQYFIALSQHPDVIGWRYRDYYFRRRQLETWAAKTIGFKWRLHFLWNKIRSKINARKIAFWYWRWNNFYKRLAALEKRIRNRAANVIQIAFRSVMLPKMRAAIKIQKIVRGYFGRKALPKLKKKIKAATDIQRIARGMLTRLSDKYILSQIFLKIPPFWRLIMNSAPPPESKNKKNKRMFQFQITDLHGATNAMVDYIMEDVARNGILAPHLPMIIPQKFDKDPYVSLSDGRMLTFFSHHDGLLHEDIKNKSKLTEKINKEKLSRNEDIVEGSLLGEKKSKPQQSVHMFNMTFWPLTEPMEDEDTDTSHFDPMVNNFEVAQNSREILYCEVCRTRLRVVECKTCTKGFCFYCAFRTHTSGGKRGHAMKIVEPRIVKIKEVSKSLIYHVDLAEKYSHDVQYLVKYLRSATEVKRLEQEKRLAQEFEQQEEIRRRAFLKAGQESHNKHEAATKISLLYRVAKAKRLVGAKRVQHELEGYTVKENAIHKQWIPVQSMFRLFSTRNWFAKKGIIWSTSRKKKRKKYKAGQEPKITKEEIRERINYELKQRYTIARSVLIDSIYKKYAEVNQLLDVNIAFWLKRESELPKIQEDLHQIHIKYMKAHEELSQWTAAQKPLVTPIEYEKLEAVLKGVMMQVESADSRHSSLVNLRWWITQHLRGCYRRRATIKLRTNDTLLRLEWLSEEFFIASRMEFQMRTRITKMKDAPGMKVPLDWLKQHADLTANHLAALDSQQETVLLEELARMNREEHATMEFDSLLEELYNGMRAESQYAAERVYLDKVTLTSIPGTDDALRWAESLILIKRKQNQLVTSVIDTLKDGLQKKLDDEDETNQLYYGFPTDHPHLPVTEFDKITAQLLDHFVSHGHFNIIDYISIYMAQPWLADMATADVKFEEQIRSTDLQRNKLHTMLDTLKHRIEDGEEKCNDLTKKMQELNREVEVRQKHLEEEGADEVHIGIIGALKTEIFKKENEKKLQEELNVKEKAQEEPLMLEIEKLTLKLDDMNERLETRIKERDYLRGRFFDQEAEMEEAIFHECALAAHVVEKQLLASNKLLRYFEQAAKSDEYIDKLVHYDIRIDERSAFQISLGSQQFHIQRCLNILRPRVVNVPNSFLKHYCNIRIEASEVDIRVIKANQIVVSSEEQEVEAFKNKRSSYEKAVQLFTDKLLYQRRQRSIQREIKERQERLVELRDMRLRLLKEEKARLLALEAEQKALEAKKKAEYVPITKQLAKIIKKGIRSAKDYIRDLKHGMDVAMTLEEKLMAKNIKSSVAETASKPEGIRKLYITQGVADMQSFYEQNHLLEDRGLPFYSRMDKSLGNEVYMWYQTGMDPKQFITHLEFGHKDPTHAKYRDPRKMEKDKYESVTHDKMNLIIWIKRDVTKVRALSGLEISYSEVDENRNMIDGYDKIDEPLQEYDLPDIYMWKKSIMKLSHSDKVPVNKLIGEFKKAVKMANEKPNDKNLQLVVAKMKDEVEKAQKQSEDFEVTNPINKAIDLMALDVNDMERWMHAFERFGHEKFKKEKEMTLSIVDISMHIEETPSSFMEHIFKSVEAFNEQDEIEFGDFMRAVSTYCFFGKQEILQFLYTFIGKTVENKITHEEFISLLNILHPYDKKLAKRALKELNMQPGKIMEFKEFKTLNDAFPQIFHPAFRMQHVLRQKTMGDDWYFDKLKKYQGVKHKLVKMTDKVDEMAVLEMQRFNEDLEKQKRMAEREKQIKKESSSIRKAILEAKQFLDEFS